MKRNVLLMLAVGLTLVLLSALELEVARQISRCSARRHISICRSSCETMAHD